MNAMNSCLEALTCTYLVTHFHLLGHLLSPAWSLTCNTYITSIRGSTRMIFIQPYFKLIKPRKILFHWDMHKILRTSTHTFISLPLFLPRFRHKCKVTSRKFNSYECRFHFSIAYIKAMPLQLQFRCSKPHIFFRPRHPIPFSVQSSNEQLVSKTKRVSDYKPVIIIKLLSSPSPLPFLPTKPP